MIWAAWGLRAALIEEKINWMEEAVGLAALFSFLFLVVFLAADARFTKNKWKRKKSKLTSPAVGPKTFQFNQPKTFGWFHFHSHSFFNLISSFHFSIWFHFLQSNGNGREKRRADLACCFACLFSLRSIGRCPPHNPPKKRKQTSQTNSPTLLASPQSTKSINSSH